MCNKSSISERPSRLAPLPHYVIHDAVETGLREDLGRAGDVTTDAVVPADAELTARIVSRANGVSAGIDLARETFHILDPSVMFRAMVADGSKVSSGDALAEVSGNARAILTGERTALNYMIRLSGISTRARAFVDAVAGTGAAICCTRKTIPGLRALEKYAVRAGGGRNHRFGLDDAILIKDNHIAIAGGIAPAIERALHNLGHLVKVEIEVDTLAQLDEAL